LIGNERLQERGGFVEGAALCITVSLVIELNFASKYLICLNVINVVTALMFCNNKRLYLKYFKSVCDVLKKHIIIKASPNRQLTK